MVHSGLVRMIHLHFPLRQLVLQLLQDPTCCLRLFFHVHHSERRVTLDSIESPNDIGVDRFGVVGSALMANACCRRRYVTLRIRDRIRRFQATHCIHRAMRHCPVIGGGRCRLHMLCGRRLAAWCWQCRCGRGGLDLFCGLQCAIVRSSRGR